MSDDTLLGTKPPGAKLRFVVLEHDSPRGRHWDLMLEREGRLRTWALAEPPDTPGPIPAEALPEHRLAYLDYEGPISGGRGQVRRWDAGTYQPLAAPDPGHTEEIYLLEGTRLRGQANLLPLTSPPGQWLFQFEPK
ncbi:MAG: hypothetical protein NZ602_13945 [Thermoguttaceae bacterium]|nr:hypothetical protein [Thermoguttaceae bacterium]MDW8039498.1 DNA polymerase ligase N-terminal domain-containing protein [Thermoguttaceae bacterium]